MHDLKSKIQAVAQAKHNLHIPTLMPDEFFLGYLGRITLINGLRSATITNNILSAWIKQGHPETKVVPSAYSLAKVSGLDLETFFRRHTLVPIVRAIKTGAYVSSDYADTNKNLDLQGMLVLTSKKVKKVACFCESCVKEDQSYLGFSFWRRSHQLSGVEWCTKHNRPLYEVNKKDAYATQPSKHFMNKNFSKTSIDQSTLNPVTLRYVQLIQDALDLKTPLDYKSTRQVLFVKLHPKLTHLA
jgi:TniQ